MWWSGTRSARTGSWWATRRDLMVASCVVGEAAWLVEEPEGELECLAEFRSNGGAWGECPAARGGGGAGAFGQGGTFEVGFASPQRAVSPGRALVLYDGDGLVLGGGWIASAAQMGAGS